MISSESCKKTLGNEKNAEVLFVQDQAQPSSGSMKRTLKQRHLSMIAIGGTIGTGLFLGIGNSLHAGGPLGLLLGYIFMGTVIYSMQVALGEMVTMFPVSGSLTHYATRFVDPALGFAVGWNYWYSFVMCLGAEVTAAAIVVQYWQSPVSEAVWITLFFFTACSINFLGVKWYGETESVFAALKIIAIAILIIVGIVLDLGGGPTHEFIGIKHWKNPGIFRQLQGIPGALGRFLAFWSVFIQASYSFLGTETVALAAAEAKNPRKTVPKAITTVFYRILLFYVTSALIIGLLVPYDEPRLLGGSADASSSPFVIAINRAQIQYLPSVINAFVLVSAYSASSSQLYGSSRILYGLVKDNLAPKFFGKCTTSGLPLAAMAFSVIPGFLAYLNVSAKSSTVFCWLVNISATTGMGAWWTICLSYIRLYHAMKAQGIDRNTLYFKAPFQPYMTYYGLVMLTLIILMNGFQVFLHDSWSWGSFIGAYISIPFFVGAYVFWKLYHKTRLVCLQTMDLHTGQEDFEEIEDKSWKSVR